MGFELLIPILAILIGGLIVILPIAGLTARFALKPIVEAWAQLRATTGEGQGQIITMMEQRLALMEQQLHSMEGSLRRLEEGAEFDKRLAAASPPPARGLSRPAFQSPTTTIERSRGDDGSAGGEARPPNAAQ